MNITKCIDIPNNNQIVFQTVQLHDCNGDSNSQSFSIIPIKISETFYANIKSSNGLCLEVSNFFTLQLNNCNSGINQAFLVEFQISNGIDTFLTLKVDDSISVNQCFGLRGNFNVIKLYDCFLDTSKVYWVLSFASTQLGTYLKLYLSTTIYLI